MAAMAAAPAAEAVAGRTAAGKAAGGAGGVTDLVKNAPGNPLNMGRRKKKTSQADRQRAEIQKIKDARPPETPAETPDDTAAPAPTPPGAGAAAPSWSPGPIRLPNAGGGLVLGSLAYIVGLTYLRSGRAGVKALLRAKFLNEVS